MEYFLDTWFLIAEFNRFDSHHVRARRLRASLGKALLVTHDGVLTEFLTFFAEMGRANRTRAAQVVRRLALESRMAVVPADRSLFIDALNLYEARPDKEYSLVDCMSMTLMKQRGITHVLTNDHHFAQEGFVVLSDAP